jgi:hypothetical protein
LIFFGGIFLYCLIQFGRDVLFYWRNGWDFSQDSGVPNAWFRIGTIKHTLGKKNSIFFGTPFFLLIVGVPVVLLVKAFLDGI